MPLKKRKPSKGLSTKKGLLSKSKAPHIVSGGVGSRMRIDGLPVVDAKKPLTLEVTLDDIKHARPLEPGGCAAAVAAMRQEGVSRVYVHLSKVYIEDKDHKRFIRYENSKRMQREVIAYDRGGSFEPEEFTLGTPYMSSKPSYRKVKYNLRVPVGNNALPLKSTWKTYKSKGTPGARPRKHVLTKVRTAPKRK